MISAAPKTPQSGKLYHFTKCRTCIESRKALKDATFECVWCLAEKSNQQLHVAHRQDVKNVKRFRAVLRYIGVAAITCLCVLYLYHKSRHR
jgi:hypothetical protein